MPARRRSEGLAVIGINIDDTAGVVDDGAAVERRHADQPRLPAGHACIGSQAITPLVNGGAAVEPSCRTRRC